MRKLFLIIIPFYFPFQSFFCQASKFEIGMEVGPTLTTLYGNTVISKRERLAFRYMSGISLQYNFSKIISTKVNFYYSPKGQQFKYETNFTDNYGNIISNATTKVNLFFNYGLSSIVAKASFGDNVKYYFFAGAYVGYLFEATDNAEIVGYDSYSYNITDNLKKHDIGVSTGFGIQLPLTKRMVFNTEIRNDLGLINISRLTVVDDGTIKTQLLQLQLGISIKLGKIEK